MGLRAATEAAKARPGGGGGGGGASGGGGWGWSGAASTRALQAAKGSREQLAAIEELAASRGVLLAEAAVADYLAYPWLPLRPPVAYLTPTLN